MLEVVFSLAITTVLLLGSPGPAPLALAATGASYGFRLGLSFLTGILCGLAVVILSAAVGIAALINAAPDLKHVCQLFGAAYILFIACKIAMAPVATSSSTLNMPVFRDGFILNLMNPKAYAAVLALFTQYTIPVESNWLATLISACVVFTVAVVVDTIWLGLGGILKPIFASPKQARVLRVIFAILMIAAVIYAVEQG
ncbi:LysE family translocator [Pseudoalteromonas fenneropenaei]|uniref:LysE family translocator n=1 Tax=Pseudoalteromonas fenneropenaei TaxID=1737459 RepID=A0ABV7CFZ3_9GAMM